MDISIPESILAKLNLDRFDLYIEFQGPALVKVSGQLVFQETLPVKCICSHTELLNLAHNQIDVFVTCQQVDKIVINDVNLERNGLIYNLTNSQEFHDGNFKLQLPVPVVPGLIKLISPGETHGIRPDHKRLTAITSAIDTIKQRKHHEANR